MPCGLIQIPRLGQTTVVTVNHEDRTTIITYPVTLSFSHVSIPEAENENWRHEDRGRDEIRQSQESPSGMGRKKVGTGVAERQAR